ncbi:DedA family protein [Methylocella silvestris]|uniref:VTT domain-containing protein n=1 Tax=Methylocella silvestris TaxID=199596 RepID=A0A2J7TE04_METSI|nr:DedA family protein [Methylocella silvestris]PNG24983.1 hypothetical protein CR492_15895 [Methylocella silvestris]
MTFDQIPELLARYGYVAIFCGVAIESAGIPFPGETLLVTGAILSGLHSSGGELHIAGVIAAAAAGAIVGDNLGFWAGRRFGFPLLARCGPLIHLDEGRLKLGQYLFEKHGGKIVFFGRFVAVLRAFAAFLAGANRFSPSRFFLFNAAGALVWASLFGAIGFVFGAEAHRIAGPIGLVGLIAAAGVFTFCWRFYKKNEARLIAEAETALPGPVQTRSF